ncbi:MAG: DMT family transporter [Proteobacteria bacterium]|nr:DMT family transporter [Pseudomonadota bacterium]MBI3505767.1 DMT family transporter [Pseudomonadota bacterium]
MIALPAAARHQASAHLALLATMLVWGTLIPVVGVLLTYMDAYAMSAARYGLGALVLLALTFARFGTAWLAGLPWRRILLLGGPGMAGFTTLYTVGISLSDPVSAAVVSGLSPVVSVIFCRLVWSIPLGPGAGLALLLGAIGSLAAVLGDTDFHGFRGSHGGEILIIASQLCWSWYSVQTQKWLGGLDQARMTAVTMAAGAASLVVIYALAVWAGAAFVPADWPSPGVAAVILWTALAITVFGVLCWNFGTSRVGIVIAAIYLNLIPVIAIMIAVALGHTATLVQLIGGALVLIGVVQLQVRRLSAAR